MGRSAIVAGTGYEGRAAIIRSLCKEGRVVVLEREPGNEHDENAIAVYFIEEVEERAAFFRKKITTVRHKIGYIKSSVAKSVAKRLDAGTDVRGYVKSFDFFNSDWPRVSLQLEY